MGMAVLSYRDGYTKFGSEKKRSAMSQRNGYSSLPESFLQKEVVYELSGLIGDVYGGSNAHRKSPISPLRLLIPASYPKCSPVVLDKLPVEPMKEHEDLSHKTKAMFNLSVRSLPQPMSLGTLARTWDVCARNVVAEYAHQIGGGSFSSQYGTWENCISA
eukprot:Gb_13857 [translate_table: standard]